MFISKKKLIKHIEAMVEDVNYFIELWQRDTVHNKERIDGLDGEINALLSLKYYLENGKHSRALRKRNKDERKRDERN